MAVDSVNNNRTAIVTGTAIAAGAAAGGAYGWKSANILEGDEPRDAFIKSLAKEDVRDDKKTINRLYDAWKKLSETGNLEDIKDNTIKQNIKETIDEKLGDKPSKESIIDYAKKMYSEEDRKAKLQQIEGCSLQAAEKRAKAFAKIEVPKKGGTLEELRKILKDNYKLFDIEVTDGNVDEAVAKYTKEEFGNNVMLIKQHINAAKRNAAEYPIALKNNIINWFESVYDIAGKKMLELPKNADEDTKNFSKLVKKAIRNFKTTSAVKWGAAGGGILGLTSFVTAKVMGKPAVIEKDCDCPECEAKTDAEDLKDNEEV